MTTSFKTSITRFTCANCGNTKETPVTQSSLKVPAGWIATYWPAPVEDVPINEPENSIYYFCCAKCASLFFERAECGIFHIL